MTRTATPPGLANFLDLIGAAPQRFDADPEWRTVERARARVWLAEHGMPTRHDEPWKYTPIDKLWRDPADATAASSRVDTNGAASGSAPSAVDTAEIDALAGDHGPVRLVFVNGVFHAGLSRVDGLPDGLVAGGLVALHAGGSSPAALGALADVARLAAEPLPQRFDGFQALNAALSPDAAVVWVDASVTLAEPVQIVHVTVPGADPSVWHPRTVVVAGAGSTATVVESYVGLPGEACTNASTVVALGEGARFTHHRVQAEAPGTIHVGHVASVAARGAALHSRSLVSGADIGRAALDVTLTGDEALADLQGLYLPSGAQHLDNVITVEHAASRTTSRELFKGVIDDAARGCFTGHVLVDPTTVATDASQTNRSLLLSHTAQTDTRPWLEILADDVKCTHGATVGRLDDEALFYLRARGIPIDQARTMLIGAFVGEILEAVDVPSLRNHLAATIGSVGPVELELPGVDAT